MAETYFKKSLKGYDTAQVDEFIVSLSDKYAQNEKALSEENRNLEAENESLKEEITRLRAAMEEADREHDAALAEKQKEYDLLCAEIGERMIVADKRAQEIIRNAEKEAALILTESRRSSENEAKLIRSRAEEEAERIIEDTRKKCESVSAAAEEFRARQNEMNRSIYETEKRFGDALSKLREGLGE